MKGKNKYDHKGKCEQMEKYIRKLRFCIRSFLELEESYLLEQKKLRYLLESADMKCTEIETQTKHKIDELDTMIADLRLNCTSLEERLAKVESERTIAIESHRNKKGARIIVERMQASLKEDIDKAQQELRSTNTRIDSLNATYRNSQASRAYNNTTAGFRWIEKPISQNLSA